MLISLTIREKSQDPGLRAVQEAGPYDLIFGRTTNLNWKAGVFMKENKYLTNLATAWMDQPEIPWNEYPRPQLRRDSFLCLNGKWNLSCNGVDWGEILVPYPPESQLSGIGKSVGPKDVLIYRRNVTIPAGFNRGRVLLHFGAVDQVCKVWWNGNLVGEHERGYLPFHFDVTEFLAEENELRVGVVD